MIIALLNQKGGAGKTILVLHLAGKRALHGRSVTFIDADPQGLELDWSQQRARENVPPLFGIVGLARGTFHHEAPALAHRADHVVIDGPPRVAALMRSALLAADLVLIPVPPSPFDGWASAEMLGLLRETRIYRPQLAARFVLNRCGAHTVIARETAETLADHDPPVLGSTVGQRVVFADAAQSGGLFFELAEQGVATCEIAALAADVVPTIRADDASAFTTQLTIDVTPAPRGRIKVAAFRRGITVADMLRDLFTREFPADLWRELMNDNEPSPPRVVPPSHRRTVALTHVELIWIEKKIEHWLRFGRRTEEKILDRRRSISSFKPDSIFAFVRWASNDFGTVVSCMDIVRAVEPSVRYQTLPFVRPGGEILLRVDGWPKVERVLQAIDAVEALDIDPGDAAPEYWRHLHNRLAAGHEPRAYTREQHAAWLKRRSATP